LVCSEFLSLVALAGFRRHQKRTVEQVFGVLADL
jgi:hypothetical protein